MGNARRGEKVLNCFGAKKGRVPQGVRIRSRSQATRLSSVETRGFPSPPRGGFGLFWSIP